MKVAFVDIDGIIANNKRRESIANTIAETALDSVKRYVDQKAFDNLQKSIFYHKDTFYNTELVDDDGLMEGIVENIAILIKQSYRIVYITSRPEYLRETTMNWLDKHGLLQDFDVICKHSGFQYTKTVSWKAGMIQTVSRILGATEIIFVDDEKATRDEVLKDLDARQYTINVYSSLQEAIATA